MKKKSFLIGSLLGFLLVGSSVSAGPHHKHGKNYQGQERQQPNAKMIMKRLSKLDLSESQSAEIKALIISGIDSTKAQRENLKAMQHQLKALMLADAVDETAIKSISMEIANVKSDLVIARLNKRHQIAALLTEDQKEKMEKMKQYRQNKKGRY